jgi:uncharacterized damage-inducible protein DinB
MLDALLDQIRRTHAGDPWYGSPRTRFLAGLTAGDAAVRPMGSAFSIWELVLHMTGWTNEVRSRLRGNAPGEPKGGDWPVVGEPSEERWKASQAALAAAHAGLVADIERLTSEELVRPVGEPRDPALGTGVTIASMLVGIAQHDAYHIGQLAVLRRALAASGASAAAAASAASAPSPVAG